MLNQRRTSGGFGIGSSSLGAGRLSGLFAVGLLAAAVVIAAGAAAAQARPQGTVVRVYDVRITGEQTSRYTEQVDTSSCHESVLGVGKQTWSSLHRGVRFIFNTGPFVMTESNRSGALSASIRYADDGYVCAPTCKVERKSSVSAQLTVRQPGFAGSTAGGINMGFSMFPAAPWEPVPVNACDNQTTPAFDGRGVDVTRRKGDTSYRISGGWNTFTSLTAHSRWRPSVGRLPFPFDVLYAGKPLTIRVSDTKDESLLVQEFNGSITIVFTPRGSR